MPRACTTRARTALLSSPDSVEQRAGDPAAVAGDLVLRATAATVGVTKVAAGTGVHGRDQLEACRKLGLPRGARYRYLAGFQRFAQHFEHVPFEFGQLIEKQYAVVRQ